MTPAPALAHAGDAEAIRNLIAEFHFLVDHGRASECLALFEPGAKLIFGPGSPNPGTIEGLEAIAAFLEARQAAPIVTRHLLGPACLNARGPDEVAARSVLTLFKAPSQTPLVPAAVADLDETYIRTAQGWRLLVREVRPVNWA